MPGGVGTWLSQRLVETGRLLLLIPMLIMLGLATVTVLKGKIWTGLVGLFVPLLLMVGAVVRAKIRFQDLVAGAPDRPRR